MTPRSQCPADSVSFTARSSTSSGGFSADSRAAFSNSKGLALTLAAHCASTSRTRTSLPARIDGEILAVVPDLICLVDEDSAEPITTEIVRYGLRVVVLGIPAPEMLKTQEALRVIGPEAFGYDGVPYVPLPGRFGAGLPT